MPKLYRATEVQNNFGYYMARAIKTGKPVYIKKHGKPVAVILGVESWEVTTRKKASWAKRYRELAEQIKANSKNKSSRPTAVESIRQLRDQN